MKKRLRAGAIALAMAAMAAIIGPGSATAAFHSTEAGAALNGTPTAGAVFDIQGHGFECKTALAGGTSSGAPNTQDLAPSLSCFWSGKGWSAGNSEGCKFRFDQFEDATLHSCKNGGIELTWDSANYHCAILIPHQTVPVAYKNGAENAFLEVAFSSEHPFTANVTKSQQLCSLKVAEGVPASLAVNYKVTTAGSFWFDPTEVEASEFHTAASAAIAGTPVEGTTTFQVGDVETVNCQFGGLAGSFPGSASSETLGELAASPATGSCKSSWWNGGITVDGTGCKYELYADGTADLKSCSSGRLLLTWNIPLIVRCKISIPNQSGVGEAAYRNHGVNGEIGVRATLDLALTGEVIESKGMCAHTLGKTVTVSQQSVTDLFANEGASELWFG